MRWWKVSFGAKEGFRAGLEVDIRCSRKGKRARGDSRASVSLVIVGVSCQHSQSCSGPSFSVDKEEILTRIKRLGKEQAMKSG